MAGIYPKIITIERIPSNFVSDVANDESKNLH